MFRLIDFSKVFDSIHRLKIVQILLANSLPKETVTAEMILFKGAKAMIRSLYGNSDFLFYFAICKNLATRYISAISIHNLRTTNVNRSNGFSLKKVRSKDILQKLLLTQTTRVTYCSYNCSIRIFITGFLNIYGNYVTANNSTTNNNVLVGVLVV